MKISYKPLPFQIMKLEIEVTKHSRTPICKSDQSHEEFDLCMYGHVRIRSHVPNDKACYSIQKFVVLYLSKFCEHFVQNQY